MPDKTKFLSYDYAIDELQTLPALYDSAIERFGSAVAMKSKYPWGHQSITYSEFGRLISILGEGLISRGLDKGDRVALLAENSPEWTVVYSSVTACGGVIVPLDPDLLKNEIRHLLIHSEAKFLITSPKIFSAKIAEMNLGDIYLIIIGESEAKQQYVTLGEIMALGKKNIAASSGREFSRFKAEVKPEDPAAICYTSGTTGGPKGALLSHRNISFDVLASLERIAFKDDDTSLTLLPLHHTFPTLACFLAPFATGCPMVFGQSLRSAKISEDIKNENITVITGVPLLFEHLIDAIRKRSKGVGNGGGNIFNRILFKIAKTLSRLFKGLRKSMQSRAVGVFGNIRLCICGAAPLRPDTEEIFHSVGIKLIQGYGLTETSPVVAVNPPDAPKRGTVGPPLRGVEVKIDDPDSEGIGEIVVRGPNVMKEYYKNQKATNEVLRDGWLFTGDLGRIDDEGYLAVVGRKKSMIVTAGGKNIHPDEIELRLKRSPYIMESIVMEVKDESGRAKLGAVIVPDYDEIGNLGKQRGGLTEESIRGIIKSEIKKATSDLPEYKHIKDFQIRDQELPKTTTNKIKRYLVRWLEE